jgi:hypothetical protein
LKGGKKMSKERSASKERRSQDVHEMLTNLITSKVPGAKELMKRYEGGEDVADEVFIMAVEYLKEKYGTTPTHFVGERVGAIAGATEKRVDSFGHGTFQGVEVPPQDLRYQNSTIGEIAPGQANPKIELDNGDVVWGCECWWVSAVEFDEMLEGMKREGKEIRTITVEQYRAGKLS